MKVLRRDYTAGELVSFLGHAARLLRDPGRLYNFGLVQVSAALGLDQCLGLPIHLFVEVSGDCNYQCVKCGRHHPRYRDDGPVNGIRNLSYQHFRGIIDELGSSLLTLRLWHYGESLLNPDLFRMVSYARDKGIFVALSTNGSLLDEQACRQLVTSELDYMIVSFDAGRRGTYEIVHGSDAFDTVRRNLQALTRIRREVGSRRPFLEFQFVVMGANETEMEDARNIATEVGADKVSFIRLDTRDVGPEPTKAVGGRVKPSDPRYREIPSDDAAVCRLAWKEAVVRYSGTVLPCVSDLSQAHPMGRLFADGDAAGFREIWNGHAYREFRRSCLRNDGSVPMCIGCTQRNNNNQDQIEVP